MVDIRSKISTRLTKESYASEEVRRHLEKLARLLTREHNPSVRFANHKTAATKLEQDEMKIVVGDHEMEQPATGIRNEAWQLLAREALLIHEIGHVKYTDFEAYDDVIYQVPMQEKGAFHKIYNAAEDAVIDQQLRWKFNCSDELDLHLANLFADPDDECQDLDLLGAIHVAILEKGVYPTGKLDEWRRGERQLVNSVFEEEFEDALGMVDDLLTDVMSEPDAKERYDRMFEFWEDLKDLFPEVKNQSGTRGDDMSTWIPDDTTGMTPGEDADELEDVNPEDVQEMVVQIGADPEEESEEGESEEVEGEPKDELEEEEIEADLDHTTHADSDGSDDEADEDQEEDGVGGKGNGEEETGDDAGSDGEDELEVSDEYEPMDLGKHEDHHVVVTD